MNPFPKKHLGQHFLRDTGVIGRIIRFFEPSPGDLVLEIGAGDGALCANLAPFIFRLIAVEVDKDCLPSLAAKLEGHPNTIIENVDILAADIPAMLAPHLYGKRLRLIGNLPYNIATAVIQKCLRLDLPVHDMLFMVQLEVAERITASAGTRAYGYFSALCQYYADARMAFRIGPACFSPRPKVHSAIIRLMPKPIQRNLEFEAFFIDLLKAAFAHRRKKILNSLSRDPVIGHRARDLLVAAGIEGDLRAENIDVAGYERLAHIAHRL